MNSTQMVDCYMVGETASLWMGLFSPCVEIKWVSLLFKENDPKCQALWQLCLLSSWTN